MQFSYPTEICCSLGTVYSLKKSVNEFGAKTNDMCKTPYFSSLIMWVDMNMS